MRVLIVVFSYTGNNRLLARHLGDRLGADVVEVRDTAARKDVTILLDLVFRRSGQIVPVEADPGDYEHVLFVAPLWDRHIATPMRAAMRQLAPRLGRYSFVTLCGGDRPRQGETIRREAIEATGRPPEAQKMMWVDRQRKVTMDDLGPLQPEIDSIVQWFGPDAAGAVLH